jgi:hypothetical protein
MVTPEAESASVAGNMVGRDNPIPLVVSIDPLANLNDLSSNLMAKDQRGLLDPIPFHDIAATDAAGLYAYQHFARAYCGSGNLLHPDVLVIVVHGNAHVSNPVDDLTRALHNLGKRQL